MVSRRDVQHAPRAYANGAWPHAPTSGPPEAEVARQIAMRLIDVIGDRSFRDVATIVGVSHTTLSAIAAGRRWPDIATVARLEHALECDLWPHRNWRQ